MIKNIDSLNVSHLLRMTDDTGIFQHGKFSIPDPNFGYTTDDNCRALIATILLYQRDKNEIYLQMTSWYLSFMTYAFKNGWYQNFMNYQRHFIDQQLSQDCFGRCLWALGYLLSQQNLPAGLIHAAETLLAHSVKQSKELTYIRAKSYSILGLIYSGQYQQEAELLAEDLMLQYAKHSDENWLWFENGIYYCNAIMPWSLLLLAQISGNEDYRTVGLKSLDFLLTITFDQKQFCPVGCDGWFEKHGTKALYDQQPVEACETLLACLTAYELTGKQIYYEKAQQCYNWYLGANIQKVCLIDSESGGCFDGITQRGVNLNQGAESLISWLISWLCWHK